MVAESLRHGHVQLICWTRRREFTFPTEFLLNSLPRETVQIEISFITRFLFSKAEAIIFRGACLASGQSVGVFHALEKWYALLVFFYQAIDSVLNLLEFFELGVKTFLQLWIKFVLLFLFAISYLEWQSLNNITILINIGSFFQHGHHIDIQFLLLLLFMTLLVPASILAKYEAWTASLFRHKWTLFVLSFLWFWLFMPLRNHFDLTIIVTNLQRTLRFYCRFPLLQLLGITGTDEFIYLSRRKLETHGFLFLLGINGPIDFILVVRPSIMRFWSNQSEWVTAIIKLWIYSFASSR